MVRPERKQKHIPSGKNIKQNKIELLNTYSKVISGQK